MPDEPEITPPVPSIGDRAHAAARALLGSIPAVGSAAVELFGAVVEQPISRRRQKWMEDVAEMLCRLDRERGAAIEDLRDNEAFVDTVLQATRVALATHHEDKRQALRGAVFNAGSPDSPDADRQAYFVRLVDEFAPSHLRVLKLFDDPRRWFRENNKPWPNQIGGARSTLLQVAYPDLARDKDYYQLIVKDLYGRGMMSLPGLDSMVTAGGLEGSLTTPLGREFIAFISAPPASA